MSASVSMANKTTIVGAGAIGGLLALALARAGHEVTLLARGRTLDTLRSRGLTVTTPKGDEDVADRLALRASDDAVTIGVQDTIVIALKAQTLPAVAHTLAPLLGPETVVLSAMNGLPWWFPSGFPGPLEGCHINAIDPGGAVSNSLAPDRAIGCVVHLSAFTTAPAIVRRGMGNHLIVGAACEAQAPRARALAESLRSGGFDVTDAGEIRRDIWAKLWGNMNMNPISALTGSTADRILDDPMTHGLVLRLMDEASTIGERLGLKMGMLPAERIAVTRKLGAFKTSMLQDLEASRPLEIEPLLGVFPELGRLLGIPTPFCDAVFGLVRQRAVNSGL
ncbi:2-dehydropantoate 2-reductase [Paraburkholderia sediminicola]|uniref:2-dehydropantoate 2-reductase n=1 Tax=Paraburkholderia sediminicola TaxID=458836 RepID=UPI0038B95F9B